MEPPDAPRSKWQRVVVAAGLVAAIGTFYALDLQRYFGWDFLRSHLNDWRAKAADDLPLSLAVFFAVYVAVTALSIPVAVPLTIVGALLFGRWVGTAVVSLASTVGATLAFLSSRYLLRDWVQRRFANRLGPLNRGVERDGAFYLFMLRLVPVVPFFLINLGMGLTPIRLPTYAFISWAGMLLGTFLYVNAAASLPSVESPSDLLSWRVLGPLALLGIAPLVVRKLVARRTPPA